MPMRQAKQKRVQNQELNHYAIRGRIELMKQHFPCLKYWNRYLANRLHRSPTAISRALKGEKPELLGRIAHHLDNLQTRKHPTTIDTPEEEML